MPIALHQFKGDELSSEP